MRNLTLELDTICLTREKAMAIKSLWESESVQKVATHADEIQLDEAAEYFFSRLEAVSEQDYCPNMKDILNVRIRTTGLKEIQFVCQI